jgi:D,D-heptose 1,7-bisphosphate phosphatase
MFDHNLKILEKKTNVLILCGGAGNRIKKITKKIPKPLINVNKIPFLFYILKNLERYNYKKIYLLTHYKNNQFKKFLVKYKKKFHQNISIINENKKLDTGGSIVGAIKRIKNKQDFLILNGDTYHNFNFDFINKKFYDLKKKVFLILVRNDKQSYKLNSLYIKNDTVYHSRSKKFINSGCYFVKNNVFKKYKIKKISFEKIILNELITKKKVGGIISKDTYLDIGSYRNLNKLESFINNNFFKKVLFIDRDNTLIEDDGYTYKIKKLKLINSTIKLIKKKYADYIKIIITNQSGIGRGYYNLRQFKKFMMKLINELNKKELFINAIYFCPHHIQGKNLYKKNCSYRKPNIASFSESLKKFNLRKKESIFLGNSMEDFDAANKLKIKFYLKKNL